MKILIPVDGTDYSYNAIRQAAKFLRDGPDITVHLLTVLKPVVHELGLDPVEPDGEMAERVLERAGQIALSEGLTVSEKTYFVYSDPAEVICRYATEKAIDQIIMGTRGLKGFRKFFLDSISDQVCARAWQPVIRIDPENTCKMQWLNGNRPLPAYC